MGPLRGVKRDLWEGGHHVPFLVRWPGVTAKGDVNDGLLSQIDLYAAIAALAGAQIPAGSAEDSFNQLPLFKGVAGSPTKRFARRFRSARAVRASASVFSVRRHADPSRRGRCATSEHFVA